MPSNLRWSGNDSKNLTSFSMNLTMFSMKYFTHCKRRFSATWSSQSACKNVLLTPTCSSDNVLNSYG